MIKKKITAIRKASLEKQLAGLLKDCMAAQERMTAAKESGDHSENAELDSARDDFLRYSIRVNEIEEILNNCEVVGENRSSIIDIGSIFKLYRLDNETHDYEFVGMFALDSTEDYLGHIIGEDSLLGKAIKGSESGTFTIQSELQETIVYKVEKLDSSYSKEFIKIVEAEANEDVM